MKLGGRMRSTAAGRGQLPRFLINVAGDRGCRGEVEEWAILVRGRTLWVLMWAQNREPPPTPSRRRTRAPISQMGRQRLNSYVLAGLPAPDISHWEFRPCSPHSPPLLTIKNRGLRPCSLFDRWIILDKSFEHFPSRRCCETDTVLT